MAQLETRHQQYFCGRFKPDDSILFVISSGNFDAGWESWQCKDLINKHSKGRLKEEDIQKVLERGIEVEQGLKNLPEVYEEVDQIIATLARYEIGTQPNSL